MNEDMQKTPAALILVAVLLILVVSGAIALLFWNKYQTSTIPDQNTTNQLTPTASPTEVEPTGPADSTDIDLQINNIDNSLNTINPDTDFVEIKDSDLGN